MEISFHFAALGGTLMTIQLASLLTPMILTEVAAGCIESMFISMSSYFKLLRSLVSAPTSEKVYLEMINKIRLFIYNIAQELNEQHPNPPNENGTQMIWLSQYSLVLLQWMLIGPLMLHPNKVGLHDAHAKEYTQSLNKIIRTLGRLIGIQDTYNLCQENVDETRSLCKLVYRRVMQHTLSSSVAKSTIGYRLACQMGRSCEPFFSSHLTGEMILKFWYEALSIENAFHPLFESSKDRTFLSLWTKLLGSRSRRTRRFLMNLYLTKHDATDKCIIDICLRLSKKHPSFGYSKGEYISEYFGDGIIRMKRETFDTRLTRTRADTGDTITSYTSSNSQASTISHQTHM